VLKLDQKRLGVQGYGERFMSTSLPTPLDRARAKAYMRLLPILFLSYAIAYVDRINVSLAAITMSKDLPGFEKQAVIGFGMGVFFLGYFLLEIPGTLLVEKWSARKWISRIMISWGFVAALTAFIYYRLPGVTWLAELTTAAITSTIKPLTQFQLGWLSRQSQSLIDTLDGPGGPFILQFFAVRFLLGLAEAGFFPGVIVYLTHWFPARDRARALSWFFIATPVAQFVSPKLSYYLLRIGTTETVADITTHYPAVLGLQGWQWMYIAWGIPAVVLGILVLLRLPDWPSEAHWLTVDERDALERELANEKEHHKQGHRHITVFQALKHPQVLLLAAAYFFVVTASYGLEFFLPKILENWYELPLSKLTWFLLIPPIGGLVGQLLVGWSSDRTGERRLHGSIPIYAGAIALSCTLLIPTSLSFNVRLALAVFLFTLALMGLKSYMPAFWALPSLILTDAAAAGSIGLINSIGNLGGFVGPSVLGWIKDQTDSFRPALLYLCFSMIVSATIILTLNLTHITVKRPPYDEGLTENLDRERGDGIIEPV
jgi:ACS family tartrate transporter-like MFS transporter